MQKSIIILLLLVLTGMIYAGNLEYTRGFEFPQIINTGKYLRINYDNLIHQGDEGNPLLPWSGTDLLLPQNEKLASVNILDISYYNETVSGTIEPSSRAFPISQEVPAGYMPTENEKIYSRDAIYPESCISSYSTNYLSGHSIGSLSICPVQFNPVTGKIRFIKSITISLETEYSHRSQEIEANLKGNDRITSRINNIVENSEFLGSYTYPQRSRLSEYDLLIITSSNLADDFEEYIEFKNSTGYSTAIETTSDIYSEYTGVDDAEKVRNCIIDYYQNYGLEYVILGGDAGNTNEEAIVPHRGFAVDDDDSLPSDMYFSNLDGNWNDDNDSYWGEQNEIDAYSEVSVGRMCVDSSTEVAYMIDKHILYQNSPVEEDIEKAVMVGEELNNSPQTNGGDYKDQIVEGGYFDGYTTTGISANFNVNYFYDRNGGWSKYDLFDEFSDVGFNLLNHLGHSNPTYNMKMENSDLTNTNFTNNGITRGFAIGYSQGCYNGSFDNWHFSGYYTEDCFAEKITGGITGGYVSCIANSRYGWYMPGGTNSSSQYYDRMFFDGIFGEEIANIGDVNSYSHEDDVSYMLNNSNMRWACYETNLFGDPSLAIWTEIPDDMTVTVPASISIGASQVNIQTDVNNARVALVQDGELIGRGLTGFNGLLNLELEAAISDPTPIEISVIAHNFNRWEGIIVVVSDQPYVIYEDHTINDPAGNNNGLADYGETIQLDLGLYNVGNQPATNTSITVSTDDEYITMIDDSEIIGTISAETQIDLVDAVSFEISDAVPDQHLVTFTVEITGDDRQTWTSYFQITVNAPDLVYGGISIDDSANGDDDGILDPGETAEVTLEILNLGQSNSPSSSLELNAENTQITITPVEPELGVINANGSAFGSFIVTVGTEIEIGTPVEFTLLCIADEYSFIEEFVEPVGLILEDFESGGFETYEWQTGGNSGWEIDGLSYEGNYSAQSGTISHSQQSYIELELNVLFDGMISFMYRVSSEAGYDFLKFYIDDVEQGAWAGENPWSYAEFDISQGTHVVRWSYIKDTYVSSGSDCAWIDYIIFPAIGIPDPAEMVMDTDEINFMLEEDEVGYANINLSNQGEANLEWSISKNYLESRDSGGPDNYGYMWSDSNEPNGVEFDWIDISTTGTELSFPHNDEGTSSFPIGFTFNFYGEDYTQFMVNANGWIGFGADNTEWSNTSLPNTDAPRPAILPFWDDLYPEIGSNGGGNAYYQSFGDHLVVMFDDVIHYPGDYNGTYDFEAVIYEDGKIRFQYNELDGDLDTCTIGIQNASGNDALQILHNDDYLEENLAIEIRKVVDWLDISQTSGILAMNDEIDIQLTATTEELESGEYTCELTFNSNDPLQPAVVVPVILNVGMGIIYGDVDSSMIVDAFDASCILQYIVGSDPLPELDPRPWETNRIEAADVDNNNILEAYDGSLVLQYVVGIIDQFPAATGETINTPESEIRLDAVTENEELYLQITAEAQLISLSFTAENIGSVTLGEPELLPEIEGCFAWSDTDFWNMAFCCAEPFAQNTPIIRIPVILGEDPSAETFMNQINSGSWQEIVFDFSLVGENENELITANELLGNYPNPFNPSTQISFNVKDDNTQVNITIYNIKGQQVYRLADEVYDSGKHSLQWNAEAQASGVYFYRINIGSYSATGKMLMIK